METCTEGKCVTVERQVRGMEDAIDVMNRRRKHNVIKWYNVNYQPVFSGNGYKNNEGGDPMEVMNRINQAKENELLTAIHDGEQQAR